MSEYEDFDLQSRYIVDGLMVIHLAALLEDTSDERFVRLLDRYRVERVTGDVGGGCARS